MTALTHHPRRHVTPGSSPFEDHPESARKARWLRSLEVGAFNVSAWMDKEERVGSRLALEEGYVCRDRDVENGPEARDYCEALSVYPSAYRLTDAGRALLRSFDARTGGRSSLGRVLSRLLELDRAADFAAEHSMCPEFEPDPFPRLCRDAAGVLWEEGWDAVSLGLEMERNLDARWDHYRLGGGLHRIVWALSPYVWPAIAAERVRVGDVGVWRHLPADVRSGRALRRVLSAETVAALDAAYDVWNPCTPAEVFRVLRGAGLLPAGGILDRDARMPEEVRCCGSQPWVRLSAEPGVDSAPCPGCGSRFVRTGLDAGPVRAESVR